MAVSLFNISSPPGGQHGGVVKHVNFLDCLDWHGDHRFESISFEWFVGTNFISVTTKSTKCSLF